MLLSGHRHRLDTVEHVVRDICQRIKPGLRMDLGAIGMSHATFAHQCPTVGIAHDQLH